MESTITATHNSDLVALSVAIAIFGSYIAIDLAQQLTKTQGEGWVRPFLLVASALILGISIWAMHFIAMLAYQLSIPFTYDFTIIYLSMTASIIGAGAGLFVVSRRQPLQRLSLWAGALLIGLGIVGLHFMAMSSLQIAAVWFYEPKGIVLSVATAIAGSGSALWLTFRHRTESWSAKVVDQIGATVLMSTAIVGMHYLAMAVLSFRQHRVSVEITSAVNHSRLGVMIAVFILLFLILTLLVYFLVVRWQSEQETARVQQQSEARFQVLIQNASDIIAIVATDGTVKYLSPSIKKVLGYSQENFLGQKAQDLVHSEDRNRAEKFLKSGDHSSNNHIDEFRLRATDGTWRDFEVTLDELLNNPDIEGMVVTCRDITERKQAEVELKASQKRYQILSENAPDAYISVAADGKIESVNQKTIDYLGYSQAELIGKAVETIIYEADRAYFRQWFRQSLQAQPFEKEDKVRKVRKDGSYFWTQGRSQLLLDRQGNPLELLMICRDITECKQTQEALEKSEAKFRSLIQNSSDLILLLDPNGIVQYASPSHQRILGYDSSWLLNQNIFDLVHPEDRENALDTFNELIAIKSNRLGTELRFQARDGSWRCLESVGNNLLDDPAVEAIVINSRDISDRKQAELQLRQNAFYDSLTGLANRILFMERLEHTIEYCKRQESYHYAVLFLDLDRFKEINDSLGHAFGDLLLVAIARRLEANIRPMDTVARLGGDEFTILLEGIKDLNYALCVAERISKQFCFPFELNGKEILTRASIGVAFNTTDCSNSQEMLRKADIEMYRAKKGGKGR